MMDRLPPELLDSIVQILADDAPGQLSAYAGISRSWQGAIEQQTFRTLDFPIADLDAFQALFDSANACRTRFLVRLDIDFGPADIKEFYSADETAIFSDWVARLLRVLANFATQATNLPALTLRLYSDGWSNSGSFGVQLPDSVPQVRHVRRFILGRGGRLHALRQNAVFAILAKLPSTKEVELGFPDGYNWDARRRRAEREALGDALCAADLSRLQELQIWVNHPGLSDENRTPDYLFPESGPQHDAYSRALRHLSTFTLKNIHLLGPLVIGVEFFANMPAFPALVDFQLDFAAETADGRWFFIRDAELRKRIVEEDGEETDEGADEEADADSSSETSSIADSDDGPSSEESTPEERINLYRTFPNPSTLHPFLVSAAHFVATSPRLRKFILNQRESSVSDRTRMLWNHEYMSRRFEIWFLRAGMPRTEQGWPQIPADAKYIACDRLYWRAGGSWRPDEEVDRAWREVGDGTKVFFLKEEGWDPRGGYFPVYLGDLEDELALD